MDSPPPNAEQRKNWNEQSGPRWVALQPRLDRQLAPFGLGALDALGDLRRARALDVGCGCGDTTLELARRVGPEGSAVGVDLSAVMIDRARERAAEEGLGNASFLVRDAQAEALPGPPFGAVTSRFGVMFFDSPAAAFGALCRASEPGARLSFVCWQPFTECPWVTVPFGAALPLLPEFKPAPPGAPGPFAFGDPSVVRAVLQASGWAEVGVKAFQAPMVIGGGGDLEEATEFLLKVGPTAGALRDLSEDTLAAVRAAVRESLRPYEGPEGVSLGGSAWVVTARRA
ncbi:MAG: class I SAM-dependent methyltransferase [Deltaproteobacteria bacterium]|nr:class I SAM-dependent methyltransferase [Deltaproteobacteria bacterium]